MEVNSIRANNVIKDFKKEMEAGKKPNLYALQKKHGYKEMSARTYMVKNTKAWAAFVASMPREEAVGVLTDIMAEGKKDSDRISAAKEILKLTDSYPTKKTANLTINSVVNDLQDD